MRKRKAPIYLVVRVPLDKHRKPDDVAEALEAMAEAVRYEKRQHRLLPIKWWHYLWRYPQPLGGEKDKYPAAIAKTEPWEAQ